MYTEEELKDKSDEWKKRHKLLLWGGAAHLGSNCGLGFSFSLNGWSFSDALIGSRLAVKSDELAVYFGKQFIQIWADYVGPFNRKEAEE